VRGFRRPLVIAQRDEFRESAAVVAERFGVIALDVRGDAQVLPDLGAQRGTRSGEGEGAGVGLARHADLAGLQLEAGERVERRPCQRRRPAPSRDLGALYRHYPGVGGPAAEMMQHGEAPQRIRMVGTVADAPGHFDGELVRPDGTLEAPGALPVEGGAGELRHRTLRIRNLGGRRGSSLNH
jgi:hypothetical protein